MEAVTVVGAGGIGCAVGHALAANGIAVTFVERDPHRAADGRAHGVRVNRLPAQVARFVAFDDWSPERGDRVLLCTKVYDNAEVLRRLPEGVELTPIQNGFDPALDAMGSTSEGIASFVSESVPGKTHTHITRKGALHLGPASGDTSAPRDRACREIEFLLGALTRHRSPAFRVLSVPDIRPYKFTKLAYNAALCPLAALGGLDNGELLRQPRLRKVFLALLRENLDILQRAGCPLGKVGPFHPSTVVRILDRPWLAALLSCFFWRSLRGTYCSMIRDLPRGKTEVDSYNGHLIRLAGERDCPFNLAVLAVVRRAEAQRLAPGEELLNLVIESIARK